MWRNMITFATEIKKTRIMEEENKAVCVLDLNGERMMPTKRFGKVRRLLKANLAKVVTCKPFTIKLLYQTKTHVVENLDDKGLSVKNKKCGKNKRFHKRKKNKQR